VAELADVAAHGDATALRSGFLLDDEATDSRVGARGECDQSRAFAVRDPHLRSVDHVFVAVPRRSAREIAGIAARVGLREREAAAELTGHETRQPPFLLVVGP